MLVIIALLEVPKMERIIKAFIDFDGKYYCAKCFEVDVFTQGKTIDETVQNLKEAITLHLEGIDPAEYGLVKNPGLLIMFECDLQPAYA